jgi:hypothetical protein
MGSLNTNGIRAIRIANDEPYKINNTGNTGIMPRGVTAIHETVKSIDFTNIVTVELMRTTMTTDENFQQLQAFAPTEIVVV